MRQLAILGTVVLASLASVPAAHADGETRATFSLAGGQPHVDVPFQLQLSIDGFDEAPAPELPKLEIPNATITPIGAQPQVSRSVQIMNGRRHDTTEVRWVLSWRIEVHKEGSLRVPSVTVAQGAKHATAQAGDVNVDTVPLSSSSRCRPAPCSSARPYP
jgi:hypothetical protein